MSRKNSVWTQKKQLLCEIWNFSSMGYLNVCPESEKKKLKVYVNSVHVNLKLANTEMKEQK